MGEAGRRRWRNAALLLPANRLRLVEHATRSFHAAPASVAPHSPRSRHAVFVLRWYSWWLAGQFRIARGAGSSDALNRQRRTTGANTRAAFVDSASRHPRHPNTNSLLSNSNPLLSQSQSTTIPLPSHYHPLPVRFCPPPYTYYVRIRGGPKTDREGMVVGW